MNKWPLYLQFLQSPYFLEWGHDAINYHVQAWLDILMYFTYFYFNLRIEVTCFLHISRQGAIPSKKMNFLHNYMLISLLMCFYIMFSANFQWLDKCWYLKFVRGSKWMCFLFILILLSFCHNFSYLYNLVASNYSLQKKSLFWSTWMAFGWMI